MPEASYFVPTYSDANALVTATASVAPISTMAPFATVVPVSTATPIATVAPIIPFSDPESGLTENNCLNYS